MPDRIGAARCLAAFALLEAVGLAVVGVANAQVLLMFGVVTGALGQALAVPSLGALALENVPASRHGAAAGMFFAYFDAGVGLGGPVIGAGAAALRPAGAMLIAAAAVACSVPTALLGRGRSRTIVLDG